MPLAQSSVPDLDLLILAFVAGFALAALIFWPAMRRKRSHDTGSRAASGREGKHALRPGTAPKPAQKTAHASMPGAHSQPAGTVAVAERPPDAVALTGTSGDVADSTHPATPGTPAPREREPIELPPPADLFQQHYAARFNRARNRIARIRDQLDKQ